jgi:hypothetical protein
MLGGGSSSISRFARSIRMEVCSALKTEPWHGTYSPPRRGHRRAPLDRLEGHPKRRHPAMRRNMDRARPDRWLQSSPDFGKVSFDRA